MARPPHGLAPETPSGPRSIAPLAAVLPNVHAYYDPVVAIAAAAAATRTITLGTSVTEPVRNHPAQLARAWLTLDHLTGGRAILGIGAGEGENITPYGIGFDKPAARLEDALRVVRLLWENDDPVDYDGPVYTLRDATSRDAAARSPDGTRRSGSPRTARVCAASPVSSPTDGCRRRSTSTTTTREWEHRARAATTAGRNPDDITAGMWALHRRRRGPRDAHAAASSTRW